MQHLNSRKNVPKGLEYLAKLDKVYMRQPTNKGMPVNSLYILRNSNGHQIFSAIEGLT